MVAWCTGAPYHRRIWTSCARPCAACRRLRDWQLRNLQSKRGSFSFRRCGSAFPAVREQAIVRLVARIRPQSGSIIETMARYLLEEAGLNVELQVQIPGMGHLDLLVDGLLGIEADGYAHHASRDAYREDRRRWNVTVVRGVPTLRVTYEMLLGEPQEFVRLVRQALATYRSAQ